MAPRMDRIFKPPFSMTGAISQDRQSCQFLFLLDKNPTVVPVGSAGERLGGARKVVYGAARSNSERAAPSACVGRLVFGAGFRLLRSEIGFHPSILPSRSAKGWG